MKRFWQTFLLLLLVAAMVLPIVACGGNKDTTNGNEIDLSGIGFNGATKYVNGSEQTLTISGKLPDGVTVRYEYWNADNTEKVSDTGVKNVGTYTVRAIFSKSGFADRTQTAKLVIKEGTAINLVNVVFRIDSVDYDGEYHKATEKNLRGKSNPERTKIRFEYWDANNEVMVDNGDLGVKEAGIYTVRAIYSDPSGKYADAYVTAQLIISKSYRVTYTGPEGTVFPAGNPSIYSLAGISEEKILLEDASLADHAFVGWYVISAGVETKVTEISRATFPNGGDIELVAKFTHYAKYPQPYQYTTGSTVAPSTLPAIPGYGMTQKNAVTILDVSRLTNQETIDEDLKQYGIKYNNAVGGNQGNYNSKGKIPAAIPAAGGGYGLQWTEYHWQAGGQYAASMEIHSPNSSGYTLQNYDMVEFWVYSENATNQVFTIFIIMENDKVAMTFDVHLDYSGWKKFSVRINGGKNEFYTPAQTRDTITQIRFIGFPSPDLRSTAANLATEEMKDVVNFIYFSNIYLTKYASDYDVQTTLSDVDLVRTIGNFASLTRKSELDDAAVAALLEKMNLDADGTSIPTDAASVFSDFNEPANSADFKAIYKRLYDLATAWKCTGNTTYYNNETLLNAIVAGMNYMAEHSYHRVGNLPALDADMTASCLYIADIMNILGARLSAEHGQSWGMVVLQYFPSSLGTSADAFLSSYINASVNICRRNVREAVIGLGQLAYVFSNREIVLTSYDANIARITALLSVATENMLPDKFVSAFYDWFYACIDAMTVDGKTPAELTAYDIVPYLRAALLLYPRANVETQNKFASYLKLYLAKDAGLEARLTAAAEYDAELVALTAAKANSTAAAEPTVEVATVYEAIGTAIYKTANGYVIVTPDGVYAKGIDASAISKTAANDTFYACAANGAVAMVRGTQLIAIYKDTVTVADASAGALTAGDDDVQILVAAPTINTEVKFTDGFFTLATTPVIAIAKKDGANYQLTVYAYAGATDLYVKGVFRNKNLSGWVVEAEDTRTIISVDPTAKDLNGKVVGKIITRTLEAGTTAGE